MTNVEPRSPASTLEVQLSIPDHDPLRQERLTRALRDEIAEIGTASADLIERARPAMRGSKAITISDALVIAVGLQPLLIRPFLQLVQAWLKARTEAVLILEHKGSRLELRGARGDQDLELAKSLLEAD